jgi:hypothetical protein
MRRTPESEKAAAYGYRGLLRDITEKISRGATREVERITGGGLSNEELVEMALAPAGGMLKVAGLGRLLPHIVKLEQVAQTSLGRHHKVYSKYRREVADQVRKVWLEASKVPEREYGRIKDIKWSSMRGQALGTKGLYDPSTKKIKLHPQLEDPGTVWHEFTHARQWSPEKYSSLIGGGTEAEKAWALRDLTFMLNKIAKESKISASDFYYKISPVERHARGVAEAAVKYPRDFDIIFRTALKTEVSHSKRKLHDLRLALGRDEAFMRGETEIQMALKDIAKVPQEAKGLMQTFSKQGLKYDAFTEPLPGYGYHQWTFYGEGPLKGATFGTKTTSAAEMKAKVTDMMKKFKK